MHEARMTAYFVVFQIVILELVVFIWVKHLVQIASSHLYLD